MLPDYSPLLDAYHRAFSKELQTMIADLPFCLGDRALDVGCGDGTFCRWLAPRVAPEGEIIGLDNNDAYLKLARERTRASTRGEKITYLQGSVAKLPFHTNSIDAIWCAQSFYSFSKPLAALKEMLRVLRPGGVLVALENDSLHHVILPWPIDVELAISQAEYIHFQTTSAKPDKFYIGRQLRHLFLEAGLKPQHKRIYPFHREAPLTHAEHTHVRLYLEDLRTRVLPYVPHPLRTKVGNYLNPGSTHYLANQHDLSVTYLDQIQWGKKRFKK